MIRISPGHRGIINGKTREDGIAKQSSLEKLNDLRRRNKIDIVDNPQSLTANVSAATAFRTHPPPALSSYCSGSNLARTAKFYRIEE
jgi:hypothetical protein